MDCRYNLADSVAVGLHYSQHFRRLDPCAASHSARGNRDPFVARQAGFVEL